METQRINKYLSAAGYCSRREADRLIAEGSVKVNGETAVCGMKVSGDEAITICGKPLQVQQKKVLIAFHKPRGIVCTSFRGEKNNVIDYIGYPQRIYPVGRLDKDSEGLLLLTNQGDLANRILKAANYHEKEYQVQVNRPLTAGFLEAMSKGIKLEELDTITRPCTVRQTGKDRFDIILTQGLNRQIRRMCETFGYRVVQLKRVRIMNIRLGHLAPGTYRNLTPQETEVLYQQIYGEKGMSYE